MRAPANLDAISDEVIDVIVDHMYKANSPRTYAVMFHMEGAVARVPNNATAYAGRDVPHNFSIDTAWLPEQADEIGASTVAFPLVSAGVYGWPKDDAVAAALEALRASATEVTEARIVAFDAATYDDVLAATRS